LEKGAIEIFHNLIAEKSGYPQGHIRIARKIEINLDGRTIDEKKDLESRIALWGLECGDDPPCQVISQDKFLCHP
jgi:hypothetical protein